jgi:hypothetical protein
LKWILVFLYNFFIKFLKFLYLTGQFLKTDTNFSDFQWFFNPSFRRRWLNQSVSQALCCCCRSGVRFPKSGAKSDALHGGFACAAAPVQRFYILVRPSSPFYLFLLLNFFSKTGSSILHQFTQQCPVHFIMFCNVLI